MRLSFSTSVLSIALIAFLAVSARALYYPLGDLHESRDVDFDDLRVIDETIYNPASGNQGEEYLERYNITSNPVALYDSV